MKVLVCGDRNWNNFKLVKHVLSGLGPLTHIIHGAARGADTIAGIIAERDLNFNVTKYPAKWDDYGNAAGPIRNREMLDKNPDIELVIAFHNFLHGSKGTKNMVNLARSRNIPVNIIREEDYPDMSKRND